MRRDGLTRPHRTNFLGSVVTYGEHEIKLWRARLLELVPTLAAQAFRGKMRRGQLPNCRGMHSSRRMAAGTVRREVWRTLVVQDGFGHDGARGVSRAQK